MKMIRCFSSLALVCILAACHEKNHTSLFERISSSHSGISFNNKITENDSINPMDVVNVYNGGGVGIGDFNNDGLPDIYFSGNMVAGKLYLNRGKFRFEDITAAAGVEGMGRWGRGVSVVDINNDGLPDIYICNTIRKEPDNRRNILYVNQGAGADGIPHFKDMAAAYGLDIHVQSTMAAFFDYDNDGDLDMYLTVNEANNGNNPSVFSQRNNRSGGPSYGKLFRNDMDSASGHPVFHDVSAAAGIRYDGYGHAATICDINNDGWKDIYISDDFLSSNILYINNGNGTFTNRLADYFKHTSYNSMGQDVADINNDGRPDVVELDMNPEDNYRKKMMLASNSYLTYQNFDFYGYQYQYVRNTLQLNQGPRVGENDTIGPPAFSEIGFLSGIAQTDWSWSPLVADLDNDGYRDLVVTNGFPRDVSDHDFMAYRDQAKGLVTKEKMLEQIPRVKIHNYAFRNNGDLTFGDVTSGWGFSEPSFSNGVAYADFDGDGALDMVINNIDDEAFLYRNQSRDRDTVATNFLSVRFRGDARNAGGLGAVVRIYYDHGKQQVYEHNPYRGYLSSMEPLAHFGLGKVRVVDSLVVRWYNGKEQVLNAVKAGARLVVDIKDAVAHPAVGAAVVASGALFREVTAASGVSYRHHDYDLIDFDIQHLLPHKLSEYCPAAAAGDVDGNGLDDLVIGGNGAYGARLLLQQVNGRFQERELRPGVAAGAAGSNGASAGNGAAGSNGASASKDEGILLFDANGDGKLDMYIASGGYEWASGSPNYEDRLYINDGKGGYTRDSLALPVNHVSKFCVRATDINGDGKLDLFVSGRVDPWNYPRAVSSFIYRNDTENGRVKFTDVTAEVAPMLQHMGMICDALFTDFDGDGQTDLLLAGEWMPVTFLRNEHGKFRDVSAATGVAGQTGWWNSIVGGDFRHTGRMDYIVGNVGLNTLYRASRQEPVGVTAKDFDGNGRVISIMSLYLPDGHGGRKEYPALGRDDVARQLPSIKKKFATYKPYALATMDELLTPQQREGVVKLQATMLQSCFLRNDGNGKFTMIPLPKQAQVSVVNGMVADDFDGDGNLDVLLNGNDYGTEVGIGRYDAMNGLLLKGDGAGGFKPLTILESGIYIPGNGKGLVSLRGEDGVGLVAATQNKDVMKLYALNRAAAGNVDLRSDDVSALVRYKNGKERKIEFYYGSSFLSQSARFLRLDTTMTSVTIRNAAGSERPIDPATYNSPLRGGRRSSTTGSGLRR